MANSLKLINYEIDNSYLAYLKPLEMFVTKIYNMYDQLTLTWPS